MGHNKYKTLTLEGNKGSSVLLWSHEDSVPTQICVSFYLPANYYVLKYNIQTSGKWHFCCSIALNEERPIYFFCSKFSDSVIELWFS